MNIQQTKKDGFDVYSFVYPAHRRTLKFVDRMIETTTSSQKFPDLYFIVLKKNGYLQALFVYYFYSSNFYQLMNPSAEVCLPHKVYSKKDIPIIDVVDFFFFSVFNSNPIPTIYKIESTHICSPYSIKERGDIRGKYIMFPKIFLRELFKRPLDEYQAN